MDTTTKITVDQRISILEMATRVAISQAKSIEDVYRNMVTLIASKNEDDKLV